MATRVRLTADVDPEVRRQVRIAAASEDKSISEWVEQALRDRLGQPEPGEATGRRYIAPGISVPPAGSRLGGSTHSQEELLEGALADRAGLYLPSPGAKPSGSDNPIKLRGGKSMSDTIIEEREERDRMLAGEAIDHGVGPDPTWYREGMAISPAPGAIPKGSENPPKLRDGRLISDAVLEDRR
jgi:hypothetical protein